MCDAREFEHAFAVAVVVLVRAAASSRSRVQGTGPEMTSPFLLGNTSFASGLVPPSEPGGGQNSGRAHCGMGDERPGSRVRGGSHLHLQ